MVVFTVIGMLVVAAAAVIGLSVLCGFANVHVDYTPGDVE